MHTIKPVVILSALLLILSACGKKERKTVGDIFTEETSVTSVIESREPEISAGNASFLQGDFEKAIRYYETGIKENRSVAYYNMGVSYYLLKDNINAEKYFRLAVEEDPEFDEAVMNLAAVLAEQEKSVEAEQYMSRLVNKKKTARVYVDMANLSVKNGNMAKARFYYDKAMEIDDDSYFVLSNYANYLVSLGELDEGERIFNRLEHKDFTVIYNLAYISYLKNDLDTAYNRAIDASLMPHATEEGNNKLAALFSKLRKYPEEAEILRELIVWNPKKDYRLRLVFAYLRNFELNKAYDEVKQLYKDYPAELDVIVAYYKVLVAKQEIAAAGRFISEAYKNYPADMLFYHYVRHICLYEYYTTEAHRMIHATNSQTPFINLARTAYYIRTGDYKAANTHLSNVPDDFYNDYYIYKSFLAFKNGQLNDAEELAYMIDETSPEYFWYHFVLAWDLRKPQRLLNLIDKFNTDYNIVARVPLFKFKLSPVIVDMPIRFTFNGDGSDMAGSLLYPLFIEPDDMNSFLALGYRLVREQDKEAAIKEFEKSLEYSNLVIKNNEAVVHILHFNYDKALEILSEIEPEMILDPFVHYNIGLINYLNGHYPEALDRFSEAIRLNRYMVPAYIGKAAAFNHLGNKRSSQEFFEAAVSNAKEYMELEHAGVVLPMIAQARFLGYLGIERPDRLLSEVRQLKEESNSFTKAASALANFMLNPAEVYLDEVENSGIYHGKELGYLLKLSYNPVAELVEKPSNDRYTLISAKNVMTMRAKKLTEEHIPHLMKDKEVLVELAYLAMFLREKDSTLKYLQMLSRLDLAYAPQYQASLYYFLWLEDPVNAEASYAILNRLNVTSPVLRYYTMLQFLINYNQKRFATSVEEFSLDFPADYRAKLMRTIQQLMDGNYARFLGQIRELLGEEPYLFDKMPLEIDIERF